MGPCAAARHSPRVVACAIGLVWLIAPARGGAQAIESRPLTLNDAVQLALKNYPAIRERRARAAAADAGIDVARTAYLPRLDLVWQENRATTNNVFGLLLPQAVIPPVSGPVLDTRSYAGVWSSAAGVLLSWDALDFGQRKASVAVAQAQSTLATAQVTLTELDVAAAAADAFLTVVACDEAVRAARANVARLEVLAQSVRTLVENQLRPGADQSRAEAELAIANNQLSQAVQAAQLARASLADAIGAPGASLSLRIDALATLPEPRVETPDLTSHPAARAQQASVGAARARQRVLDRSYFPRVIIQGALSARGSGAEIPGQPSLGNGLWLQVPNWAVGASVVFPALDLFAVRAKKRVETHLEAAESARYDRTVQTLTTQAAKARALMTAAIEIARNTPLEQRAATDAENRARVRYESGLAPLTEVADAQRLLAQADMDAALARLGVWRALLALAQVGGDLTPFLDEVMKR